ncbi:cytochrome-c peroxidase [Flagellimonas sp. 2504JD4-2]
MKHGIQIICIALTLSLAVNCRGPQSKEVSIQEAPKAIPTVDALPTQVVHPKDNPPSEAKEKLGKLLFYDPILSGNKDVSCVTCHHPDMGYAEFLDISIGTNATGLGSKRKFNTPNNIPFVKRNAQTVINTAFNGLQSHLTYVPEDATMFWDDRAKSLEKQAIEPIKALEEMRGNDFTEDEIMQEVVERLKNISEYQKLFAEAFDEPESITIENLGKAIAAFERTLIANNSRFDQYIRGDSEAISISEKDGFELFKSVGCINCHSGPMFSDYKMHVLGVPENSKLPVVDHGVADVGLKDSFAFRTPTLRNLRFTAPYMHNGSFVTLRRVLEFYEDISNNVVRNPNVDPSKFDPFVRELRLSVKEMALIISFLNTLNDDGFDKSIPENVPSGLPVGGLIN